jgi:hypothetical protein
LLFQPELHFFSTAYNRASRINASRVRRKPMCPVCLTTAALIAGSITSTGGLATIAIKKFGGKHADNNSAQPDPNSLDKSTEQ